MKRAVHTLVVVSALFVTAGASGCVHTTPPAMTPALAGSCRTGTLRWFSPSDDLDRARLDSWCAGVGQAVVQAAAAAESPAGQPVALEDVTFVSWNVHVGNGDIDAFVKDLRAGRLTNGRPVRDFVLMLQEVVREHGVPPYSEGASGARRIGARTPSRSALRRPSMNSGRPEALEGRAGTSHPIDIGDISRDLGLSLVYVPSMRNGDLAEDAATDRGSAIVSTLPLSDPIAVELPGERQRRVAVFAKVSLRSAGASETSPGASEISPGGSETSPGGSETSSGASQISVGVVHLDALGASTRFWLFGTSWMRELQVKSMESLLPGDNLVLGADLNTWHGAGEPAPRYLTQLFGKTPVSATRNGLRLRVLDYLFFRAAGHRSAHYEVVRNDYGSDHRPLVGSVTAPGSQMK